MDSGQPIDSLNKSSFSVGAITTAIVVNETGNIAPIDNIQVTIYYHT
jgi:hypothetical protein